MVLTRISFNLNTLYQKVINVSNFIDVKNVQLLVISHILASFSSKIQPYLKVMLDIRIFWFKTIWV